MAVTSIWAVSKRLNNAINYVRNPEKTTDRPELSHEAILARKAVGDVIDYAANADKTDQRMYVTGINCSEKYALEDFMLTKKRWHKEGGRLAYHGYQAFREGEGEITAELAHEIGVKLAKEVWGNRFEVLVATHLNTGHYHNHFIVNSVSFSDGLKYIRSNSDYRYMKDVSDRLCREAGLHVLSSPSSRRGKSYDEWLAERDGKPTVRGMIREDIDRAIWLSRTEREFITTMKKWGYKFRFYEKDGKTELKHPGIKPFGAKSYFRFCNLGDGYDIEQIKKRIMLNTTVPTEMPVTATGPVRSIQDIHDDNNSLHGIYRRYCVRLYTYVCHPRKREFIPMALREDIIKLDHYIELMDLLYGNHINDKSSLIGLRESWQLQLTSLLAKRKMYYAQKERAIRMHNNNELKLTKAMIANTSKQIRELRKKIKLADEVVTDMSKVYTRLNVPDKNPEIINKNQKRRVMR